MDGIVACEERFDEVKKALRSMKCCNRLNWDGPSAHEVILFTLQIRLIW